MATSEQPSRHHHERQGASEGFVKPWYLQVGVVLAVLLAGILIGLVVGFIWATARDYSTLAVNGREIHSLTRQVATLKHQVAVLSLTKPRGNWWSWWAGLPFRHLWLKAKFW